MLEVVFFDLRRFLPMSVGEADLGWRLAILGHVGERVFTHNIRGVDCAREVRAAWRVFFPDSEGAGDDAW